VQKLIVGSKTTVTAPSPQVLAGATHSFTGWSNGGARSQELVVPGSPATYTATFTAPVTAPPAPPPPLPPPPPPKVACAVPRVVGTSLAAARRALVAAHCSVGRVTKAYSPKVRRGRVMDQSPRPRTRLRRGGAVRLVVSRGAQSVHSRTQAVAFAHEQGLNEVEAHSLWIGDAA
jgi:hypothetical protein